MIELFLERLEVDPCYCIGSDMLWLGTWHDVDVEFPVWVNSKGAIKEFGEVFKHFAQILFLSCAEVCALLDNLVGAHLLVLDIQDLGGIAV